MGSLTAIRDYIDLEKASQQLIAIAQRGATGEIYNVASGNPVAMHEILDRYLVKNSLPISVVRSGVNLGNHRGYDVPMLYANMDKTRSIINGGGLNDKFKA